MPSIFRNLWGIRLHRRSSVFGTLARNYPPLCDSNQTKTKHMNLGFFIMGGLIFAVYCYFTIWNIFYGARKQREENYPNYYDRHGQMGESKSDAMDMDGMGNFSRFPVDKEREALKKKRSSRKTKTKTKKPV